MDAVDDMDDDAATAALLLLLHCVCMLPASCGAWGKEICDGASLASCTTTTRDPA
ncbi:hypothetical protein EDC01DRAFT_783923 [Geopyxis carbonaria]|nr:hypothetical protein EDC01DRAFT_783923 [Geopyxis carbonaria]